MKGFIITLFVVAFLAAPVVAHGDHDGEDYREQKVRAEGQVRPGSILELDFSAHEGSRIAFGVDARVPVSWDIHEHTAAGIVTHMDGRGVTEASDVFIAPHDGVFSFMVVSYDNSTGKVRMSLDGTFALVSNTGVELQGAPGPAVGLVALALGGLLWSVRKRRHAE
jgi:LPXTG-motif cell wall-anchored protein